MKARSNQSGFSAVELIIVVLVIGVLGFVGYSVYNQRHKTETAATGQTQTNNTGSKVGTAPDINSTSDLNKALNTLNQNDPATANSSDSAQLYTQTSGL